MSDATKKADKPFDVDAMHQLKGTAEVMEAAAAVRAAKQAENDRDNAEYKYPDTYNSKMGLKQGSVTELRMFFKVIPGHADALREELTKFMDREARNSKLAHLMTGIQTMTCTLFDNDTRYLHTTEFDTEWDPYIEDSLPTLENRVMYANWFQHLEETKQFTPDNPPTANDVKVAFNSARVTAHAYIRTFGESCHEEYKMRDLKKAFDELLDSPDAEEALSHPALKKLLDLAAD